MGTLVSISSSYQFELMKCHSTTDLQIDTVYAGQIGPVEIISALQLASAVAIIPFEATVLGNRTALWAIQSFDRVCDMF